MPHSSGGGSHSGGSHSSHSSSSSHSSHSGGGGGSSRRSSSTPFPGSRRFLYYNDNKPYFIYTNYDIRKPDPWPRVSAIIVFCVAFLPFLILSFFLMIRGINIPHKLENSVKNPKFIVEDNIGVIEDKKALKQYMREFYDTTGITPAVITVRNEDWNEDYTSLENYAYDVYLDRFDDETHWLFIYSESIKDNGFNDWYWEGMQGDDTDNILTSKRANEFTEVVQKRLIDRDKYSVDAALGLTLDEFRPKVMKPSLDSSRFISGAFMFIMMSLMSFGVLANAFKPVKIPEMYKKAQPCELTAVYQEPCNFCGGIYIIGMHTTCPHCGAALPAHHYIKDAQGNIVKLLL